MTSALVTVAPKLSKLIPLLGSDKSGEVIATVCAIGRTLKQTGADFHDLATAVARTEQTRTVEPVCWRDLLESEQAAWLAQMSGSCRLAPWEQDFASSILAQVRFRPWSALSPKQVAILDRRISKFIAEAWR